MKGRSNVMITRRKFLKWGVGAAVAVSTPNVFSGCEGKKSPLQPPDINAQVSAVRGNDLDTITRNALDALGGIGKIVNQGETVFIKPNMVTLPWAQRNPFIIGECTKSEIIIAVAEECLKAGASHVIIGDGSQMYTFDWHHAVTLDGSTDLVQEAVRLSSQYNGNATLACLEDDSPEFVNVPSSTYLGEIAVSSLVTSADRVISIPVAKTHSWAQLTLALKNFVGVTSLERYAVWVNDSHWDRGGALDHSTPQAIGQIYLDVVDAVRPDLSIIDFSIGIEGDGPTLGSGGTTVNMRNRLGTWLVIASTDIMAADATAARIMSHDVGGVKQLGMGFDMDLGEIRRNSIEMIGEKLDNLVVPWAPANLRNAGKYAIREEGRG